MLARTTALGTMALVLLAGCGQRANLPTGPQGQPSIDAAPVASGVSADDGSAPELPGEPALADYLRLAALRNPGLWAAFDRWQAALEQIPQARSLPDPRLGYAYYIQEVETRVGPQRHRLELSQRFPWPGKLDLRGGVAAEAAQAARQRFHAARLALFHRVKQAYYEYYYLGRATAIAEVNYRLLKRLEGVVRARYKAAAATGPDLIRLQVELGRLEDRFRSLKDRRSPVMAALAAAVGLVPGRELPLPQQIEQPAAAAPEDQLIAWAGESNPHLKELDAEIARAGKRIELARKDYLPDVTLGVGWIETGGRAGTPRPNDSGQDAVTAMVSVNLPIWRDRLAAGVRQARLHRLAAVKHRDDAANNLAAEVKQAAYEYRDAQAKVNLYGRMLLPRAGEALKVTEAAFRAAAATFTDLIDAQRVLLEFQLTHERALTDRAERLARLEMLVGREISPPGGTSPPGTRKNE